MKLVTAIVHNEDAATLVDALLEKEYRATRFNSSGGFLKQGNATILVGVEDDQVDDVLAIISANCHSRKQFVNPMPPIMEPGEFYMPYPVEVEVGGATVFVQPVERFERLYPCKAAMGPRGRDSGGRGVASGCGCQRPTALTPSRLGRSARQSPAESCSRWARSTDLHGVNRSGSQAWMEGYRLRCQPTRRRSNPFRTTRVTQPRCRSSSLATRSLSRRRPICGCS